jgi:hypothetical protein
MILALAVIAWLLYENSAGTETGGIIPESYQRSLDQARGVQGLVEDSAASREDAAERN